jgi:hypothetical protein
MLDDVRESGAPVCDISFWSLLNQQRAGNNVGAPIYIVFKSQPPSAAISDPTTDLDKASLRALGAIESAPMPDIQDTP